MNTKLFERLDWIQDKVAHVNPLERIGRVVQVTGLLIESQGPDVALGDIVEVENGGSKVSAEVVGFKDNHLLLMALGQMKDIRPGSRVLGRGKEHLYPIGEGLVGRVIDGLGRPIDGKGPIKCEYTSMLSHDGLNPMNRQIIDEGFETGIKAIDAFVPVGRGQRMGIFAGSGVGKSTLLGMMARGSEADINVIALIGERGRELREFIENDLTEEGLSRSVIVISTSDQPAPLRIKAAHLASRIAEEFREKGKNVLFMMDSVTRFAMAQREIGLAIGEPPATRGYTPSVFAMLPQLVERSGMSEHGSMTALYTVLVEGDDMNEPIADAVRGLLDGHIVLSRKLATANQYPAVDVLESVSRLVRQICTPEEVEIIGKAKDLLALYRKNEDLISVGAYIYGTNARVDRAIEVYEVMMAFLKQSVSEKVSREQTLTQLKKLIG